MSNPPTNQPRTYQTFRRQDDVYEYELQFLLSEACMVITYSKKRINRVRLPILLVVSWTGKMHIFLSPFAPENLASRDGLGSPVPRQLAHLHTQVESDPYLRDSSRFSCCRYFSMYFKLQYSISVLQYFSILESELQATEKAVLCAALPLPIQKSHKKILNSFSSYRRQIMGQFKSNGSVRVPEYLVQYNESKQCYH